MFPAKFLALWYWKAFGRGMRINSRLLWTNFFYWLISIMHFLVFRALIWAVAFLSSLCVWDQGGHRYAQWIDGWCPPDLEPGDGRGTTIRSSRGPWPENDMVSRIFLQLCIVDRWSLTLQVQVLVCTASCNAISSGRGAPCCAWSFLSLLYSVLAQEHCPSFQTKRRRQDYFCPIHLSVVIAYGYDGIHLK